MIRGIFLVPLMVLRARCIESSFRPVIVRVYVQHLREICNFVETRKTFASGVGFHQHVLFRVAFLYVCSLALDGAATLFMPFI